ncbi:hypothetical protein MBGDN05_00337 [Thermoplasmatales archaeon SCGC AB-539-N05]|nr:hypothetical protein MBGDN05_00337 [Thermoplasmatales archaeon SCGC AB-539-N05]
MAEQEKLTYKDLREIQQKEKNSPLLTKIEPDFYETMSDYIESLQIEYREEKTSSPKSKLLKDEISNIQKIAIGIYEQREKKIVQMALSILRSGQPNIGNMTDEEKSVFDAIIDVLSRSRKKIIVKGSKQDEESKENFIGEKLPDEKPTNKQQNSSVVIRLLEDVPVFIGPNMKKYNLKKDDVAALPREIADVMVKRNVAGKIEKIRFF